MWNETMWHSMKRNVGKTLDRKKTIKEVDKKTVGTTFK